MPTQVQFRRGTTGQNNTYTGAEGELTVDTTTWGVRVHDGTTAGGHALEFGSANSLAGGSAGAIPYQIASSSTGFISIGAADTVLVSNGSTATWVDLGTLTGSGGVNADNLLVNSITNGDRYLVVTDQTGAYTALEASTLTIYNSTVGLTLKNTATIGGHLLPETNGVYDLGSSNKRWRSLYVTSSTIDIAGSTLKADGSSLYFNDQLVATGFVLGDYTFTNLVVSGNLTVSGTSTFVNSTVTNVSDPIFGIGGGVNGAAPASDDNKDRGIAFQYHTGSGAKLGFFGFDDSTGYFTFVPDATISNEVVSGSTGDFQANNFRGNLVGNVTGSLTGVSTTATNIAGGTAGQLLIQSSSGTTAFVPVGTAGQFLQAGANTATFVSTSSMYVASAVNSEKWTTARTISLGGDLSGSMVLDGSQNVTLTATVAIDTIALGTDTTGVYVAQGDTSGFGLSGSASTEGSTFTVTANSTSANTVSTIVYRDASGNFSAGTITATGFNGPIIGTATNATTATNIAGGTAGQLLIQSGAGTTAFVPVGTAGQFLQAGTNTATFVSTSSMYVASAVNSEKWTTARTISLGGDLSGSMVLDGSQNVTLTATVAIDTIALGTDTTGVYVAQGATSGFGLSGSASTEGATFTVTANSTSANTVSTIVYRDASGNFSAGTITATGFNGPITGTATNATTATNIAGGTAGQLHIQSGSGTTAFVPVGTAGQFLQAGANTATFVSTSSMYVADSVTSTNIRGGAAGSIPYNTASGITSFLAIGTNGFVLTSNGTAPVWSAISGLSAGQATTATNLAGGTAGQIPIQSGAGTTAFVPVGTAGQFLQAGTNTATFVSTSSMYVNAAVNAQKWLTARTFTFGGDLSGSMVVDGSQNVTFTATIAADSVALGTDTTGVYVAQGATSGFGLSGSASTEGSTFTVTANSTSSNTVGTIMFRDGNGDFSAGGANFSRPVTFGDNVTFSGTATFVYSTNTVYTDNIINVHTPPGGSPTNHVWSSDDGKDIGFIFHYYKSATDRDAFLGFNNSTQFLEWWANGSEGGGVYTGTTYGTFRTGSIRLMDTTAVNSTNSGALQVGGGVGINGGLFVGGVVTATTFVGAMTGTATTSSNVAGGTAGQLHYQSAPGVTAFAGPGTAGQILVSAGTGAPTYTNTGSIYVADSVTSTNIRGGTAGQLHIQSGAGTTAFVPVGTAGQFLQAGANTATFVSTSSIYVNAAVNAEKWATARTFTFGGDLSGSMVVDGSQNVTFTATIAADSVALGTDTTGVYVAQGATSGFGLSGSASTEGSTFTVTANSTSSNTAGTIVYRDASGNFSAGTITATAFSGPITGTATNATTATNIAGGAAGQIPIQSGAGTTAFVPVGTAGQFLQAGTNTATFVSTSSMYVNAAVNAQKWLTARTFTFGGDLSGSMVVDGSQNVTFTATIAADSVALGTDTTGNYVASGATSGFGLSGSASAEGATFTVTANSTSANTVSTIVYRDASGNFSAGIVTATNISVTAVTSATTTQTGALIVTGGLGVGNNVVAGGALFVGTPTGTVGVVGEIRATNEITAYYSSDQALKENVVVISNPIEMLNQIKGVYFDWKDSYINYRGGEDGYFVRKHDVGVIAQDVEKVLPQVVAHKGDGYLGVKYEKIIPLLIEAIKDQQRQISQLSEQVNKLVNK